MASQAQIEKFLSSKNIGVVGASKDRGKYGNKVLRCYQRHGYDAIPVHPALQEIEGVACVASVSDLPDQVKSISVITPPQVTEKIVPLAVARGIENIWMQPGAQSAAAVRYCEERGINLIADGTCILVTLGFNEH